MKFSAKSTYIRIIRGGGDDRQKLALFLPQYAIFKNISFIINSLLHTDCPQTSERTLIILSTRET